MTSERDLKVKMYNEKSGDAVLTMTGRLSTGKDQGIGFTFGYGTTIGDPFQSNGTSMGTFGSGIGNSSLARLVSNLGPVYASRVNNTWGNNGVNLAMEGKLGVFNFGGSYVGFLNAYNLSFGGTIGTFTGKGLYISDPVRKEQMMFEGDIKF